MFETKTETLNKFLKSLETCDYHEDFKSDITEAFKQMLNNQPSDDNCFHYFADSGQFVINNVQISNHCGDGVFNIYVSETLPTGFEAELVASIDAKNIINIRIYDCLPSSACPLLLPSTWENASIYRNQNGDFAFVKAY